jgi:hypothetical protein
MRVFKRESTKRWLGAFSFSSAYLKEHPQGELAARALLPQRSRKRAKEASWTNTPRAPSTFAEHIEETRVRDEARSGEGNPALARGESDRGKFSRKAGKNQNSLLPVVHTFTDVAKRKRNVRRVDKQYMVENDSRNAPYKNTIEETVNSFNARAIRRYASKSGLTPEEVKRNLAASSVG